MILPYAVLHGSNWCFQIVTSILDGFLEFLVLRVNEIDTSQFSRILELRFFHVTTFASPSAWHFFPLLPEFWPWMIWPGCQLSQTTEIRLEVLLPIEKIEWNLFMDQTSLLTIDIPKVIDAAFWHKIQVCLRSSGDVNVFQWNGEWFFSRRLKFDSGFNVMAAYEVSKHGPEINNCFTNIRKRVVRWWKRPFWFFEKINVTFSLNWSLPYQSECSQVSISSKGSDSSICDWK